MIAQTMTAAASVTASFQAQALGFVVLALFGAGGIGWLLVSIAKARLDRRLSEERTQAALQRVAELQASEKALQAEADLARAEREKSDRLATALVTKVEADTRALSTDAKKTKRGEFTAVAAAFGVEDALDAKVEELGFKGSKTKPESPATEEGKS